ncbi:MAG: helix-turn-helix domain-containing protein, partial [Pseudonocardia sp.]
MGVLGAGDVAGEREKLAGMWRGLGRQLSVWRRAAEVTQRQLGQVVGYERTAVAHVEAGRRRGDE